MKNNQVSISFYMLLCPVPLVILHSWYNTVLIYPPSYVYIPKAYHYALHLPHTPRPPTPTPQESHLDIYGDMIEY